MYIWRYAARSPVIGEVLASVRIAERNFRRFLSSSRMEHGPAKTAKLNPPRIFDVYGIHNKKTIMSSDW